MKRLFTFLIAFLFVLSNTNSQVLINQIYGAGGNTGATWNKDVVQLINKGNEVVILSNYALQYASATGSTWNVDLFPDGTSISPDQILNVMLAGGANGIDPPSPKVQALAGAGGLINMGAIHGKIVLTNTTTIVTGGECPVGSNIIDYVGFGSNANCGPHTTGNAANSTQGYWRTNTSVPGSFDVSLTPLASDYPLGIELISINTAISKKNVIVSFSTSSESNSSHFEIERSPDGTRFGPIGRVLAAGHSRELLRYSYTDEKPLLGRNYYRLKMVDRDGSSSYSRVVSAMAQRDRRSLELFPAAAENSLEVSFGRSVDNGRLHIYDLQGQVLQSYVLAPGIDILRIDLSGLMPGNYIAVYIDGDETVNARFVKL